jgi:hypothetical protein
MELSMNKTGSDYDLQTADPVTGNIIENSLEKQYCSSRQLLVRCGRP